MNFNEAVVEVLAIVKRPDKAGSIAREVNSAISFFCSDADFRRDIAETLLTIDPAKLSQNVPYSDMPRFRKIQYIKQGGSRTYLTELEVDEIPTANYCLNKYYLAGSGIRINMGTLSPTLDVGYFQYPPTLTSIAPDFWLLEAAPYMVIDQAAGKVFTNIGDDASGRRHLEAARLHYLAFRADHKAK